jgi:hypothetical protein
VQACSKQGFCEVLCASDRDCTYGLTTGICDDPNANGRRYCLRE